VTIKRFTALKPWIEDKKVLDIGCVKHDWHQSARSDWIHALIIKHSKEAIGIDISEEGVRELAERGYKVEVANAENFELNTHFDVIFAGELIEHLEDKKGFINSCKKHMNVDSKLIITTPNSFGIVYFFVRLIGINFINSEHTCWFDEQTLEQLLNRHDLQVIEKKFLPIYSTNLSRIQSIILRIIEVFFPRRFRATLFFVSQIK
jgi:2-polyprenyl-3-methyl-5-hydroxy-6-metoxy-1,4-benzoquinol methylase